MVIYQSGFYKLLLIKSFKGFLSTFDIHKLKREVVPREIQIPRLSNNIIITKLMIHNLKVVIHMIYN